MSAFQFFKLFSEAESRKFFETMLWDNKPTCPICKINKKDRIYPFQKRPGYYRCKDCRFEFTIRNSSLLHGTKLPFAKWLYAIYLMLTARKGISSLQLSRELGVTQKTAWFLGHRIREAFEQDGLKKLSGIVEVDETMIGGIFANMSLARRKQFKDEGRTWYEEKSYVFGMRSRETGEVRAHVVARISKKNIEPIIRDNISKDSTLSSDESNMYVKLNYKHIIVNHSVKEFVNHMASTNGIESVWALIKRGYNGTFHSYSQKHLSKYIDEFCFRLNKASKKIDVIERLENACRGFSNKTLSYKKLKSD